MTLKEQMEKKKNTRNTRQLKRYHFARSLGFKADAATILMNRSEDNIRHEARLCGLTTPDTATPQNNAQDVTDVTNEGELFNNVNKKPTTRLGATFDKELHDRHMGGND